MFFNPTRRLAIAPVFQLLAIRREPGLSPVGSVCFTRRLIPFCLEHLFRAEGDCHWSLVAGKIPFESHLRRLADSTGENT